MDGEETHPLRAAMWMLAGVFAFSSMALAGRRLAAELDTFEIMAYRSLVAVLVVTAAVVLTGRRGEIDTRRLPLHLARNVSHFAGQNLWFYALATIPLAQVFALEFTAPLWVGLLAPLVLGERLTRGRMLALLAGFAGILIVARPGVAPVTPGTISALAAAVGFAGSLIFTKLLTRQASVVCILYWLSVMQTAMGWVCAGWDGDIATPSAAAWPFVAAIAVAGLAAHLCLTTAVSLAPATVVIPFDFLRLPLIAVVGAAFYGEPVELWVILGAALIFGAAYANLWSETRGRGRRAAATAVKPGSDAS